LTNIGQEEVSLDISLQGDVKHAGRDVHADPNVRPAFRRGDCREDFARQTGPAAYVENKGRGAKVKEM
jgi:hypothetical protein